MRIFLGALFYSVVIFIVALIGFFAFRYFWPTEQPKVESPSTIQPVEDRESLQQYSEEKDDKLNQARIEEDKRNLQIDQDLAKAKEQRLEDLRKEEVEKEAKLEQAEKEVVEKDPTTPETTDGEEDEGGEEIVVTEEEIMMYISQKAEERGYQERIEASVTDLVTLYQLEIHKDVKDDLHDLLLAAAMEGVKINFLSGFRGYEKQKELFFDKLGDDFTWQEILDNKADDKIDYVLSTTSFPGYSKHHTGKIADFSCNDEMKLNYAFAGTECFQWLAQDDFTNAKKYNFYPSYPEGGENMGPAPEPWEFIWEQLIEE